MPTIRPSTPDIAELPTHPASWYFVCESRFLEKRPVEIELAGERAVVFRDELGRAKAIGANCPHLGARLVNGDVVDGKIRCPFHAWEIDGEGRCSEGGRNARRYATAERYAGVFVYPAPVPLFGLPEFDEPDLHLASARPFHYELELPWFMVAAQCFDLRHFLGIHERRLEGPARVEEPCAYSRRLTCGFTIEGGSWVDRATRWVSGDRVEFQMTTYAGNIVLVRTRFSKDRTYGFVITTPIDDRRVRITIIANASKSRSAIARAFIDPIRLKVKRLAIQSMTRHDLTLLDGLEYASPELGAADQELAAYLRWVADFPRDPASEISALRRRSA